MKRWAMVAAMLLVSISSDAADNYAASVDFDSGLIRMVFGPTTATNIISADNPQWSNVYMSKAEYQTMLGQLQGLPPDQWYLSYLPTDKLVETESKAKSEAADYDKWREQEKALARLFVKEINKLRALHGLPPYTAAQVKAALKAEMND